MIQYTPDLTFTLRFRTRSEPTFQTTDNQIEYDIVVRITKTVNFYADAVLHS